MSKKKAAPEESSDNQAESASTPNLVLNRIACAIHKAGGRVFEHGKLYRADIQAHPFPSYSDLPEDVKAGLLDLAAEIEPFINTDNLPDAD